MKFTVGREVVEETLREWKGRGVWGDERVWKKKKRGIGHPASQRREVGDSKRPRRESEERTKQPVRVKVRGNESCGT